MLASRSIPSCTVIPEVAYPDVMKAAEWLSKAFGFRVRLRIGDHRVQMHVGDGAMVVVERREESPVCSRTMVRVEDIDEHCRRAVENGAEIVQALESHPYGERQYMAKDLAGNLWKFSETLADVDPAKWGGELVEPD